METRNESAWTGPRPDCEHPEWWHSDDPQSTEHEVTELVRAFVRALQPEYVVETGTFIGQTALAIGLALMENGHGVLDTIEYNQDMARMAFETCAKPWDLPVTIEHMSSLDFTPRLPINFAWLDSDPDLRVREFEHFREHFAPGCVIGVHDTGPHQGLLGEAIRAIPGTVSLQLPTPRGVTFLQVR